MSLLLSVLYSAYEGSQREKRHPRQCSEQSSLATHRGSGAAVLGRFSSQPSSGYGSLFIFTLPRVASVFLHELPLIQCGSFYALSTVSIGFSKITLHCNTEMLAKINKAHYMWETLKLHCLVLTRRVQIRRNRGYNIEKGRLNKTKS